MRVGLEPSAARLFEGVTWPVFPVLWFGAFMRLILKFGPGIKKVVVPIGRKVFETVSQQQTSRGRIETRKTLVDRVRKPWLIEQYQFCFFDRKNELTSFLLGYPDGVNDFYIQEMRSTRSRAPSTDQFLSLLYEKAKVRMAGFLGHKRANGNGSYPERGLVLLWEYMKDYLKGMGIRRLLSQAEFEIFDTVEINFKIGWRDVDRGRGLERCIGNIESRRRHYSLLERLTGVVYLEYLLHPEQPLAAISRSASRGPVL